MKKSNSILKTFILTLFPIIALILCLFSNETSQAARKALYLCLDIVIPSLFPFFVLSRVIMPFIANFSCPNFLKYLIEKFLRLPYYTIVIILIGFVSGYPNGAKMSRDMFDQGLIDSRQATKILTVSNYCSPLFVMGTIGAGLFKSIKLGLFLLLIHWISGLTAAFITAKILGVKHSAKGKTGKKTLGRQRTSDSWKLSGRSASLSYTQKNSNAIQSDSFSVLLTASIEDAAILCIKLTGYIVFFAVLAELLSLFGVFSLLGQAIGAVFLGNSQGFSELIAAVFRGIMEITSGAQAINQVKGIHINMQLAATSLIFGFAGFSAHTQIIGIMKGTGSKYGTFFIAKLLHGFLACAMTILTIYFMPMTVEASTVESPPASGWPWIRPVMVLVIVISLAMAPYRAIPLKKKVSR